MRLRAVRPGLAAIGAIALSTATISNAAAPPEPLPAPETVEAGSALGGNPLGIALALILTAAVLYGIYDVLLQGDHNDKPASP